MKSITKTKSVQFRRTLLASACAMAVAAPSVFAQTALFTFAGGTIAPASTLTGYVQQVLLDQINEPLTQESLLANTNAVQVVPVVVSNDTFQSLTFGNVATNFQAVSVTGASNSIGNLLGQAQTGTTMTATVDNADAGLALNAAPPSTNTVTGNTIQAVVGGNTSNVLTGKNPDPAPIYDDTGKLTNYTNTDLGSLTATEGASITTTTTGSIVAVSNQISLDSGVQAGSQAAVTGSSLSLTAADTTGGTINLNQTLTGNTITAQFTANAATVGIAIDSGSTPLNGSAAVGNFQGNLETGAGATTGLTATVSTSSITTDLRDGGVGITTVSSSVTNSTNAITAISTGNSGDTSLTLGSGVNLAGSGTAGANSLDANTRIANADGDLALLSVQGNSNTGLNSSVSAGTIRTFADNLVTGGSVTMQGNTVGSSATGNTATNLVQAASTSVVGSVSAGNMQINDATTVTSTTTGAEISSNIGTQLAPATGAVTLSANTISAAATGSLASTQVLLDGTNALTLTSGGAGATVDSTGDGVVSTGAGTGASATNFQANYGSTTPITSEVLSSNIRADFVDQTGANARTSLDTAQVTVSNNSITSDAIGTKATTTLALGTVDAVTGNALSGNITGSGAVANGQLNESPITANVSNSGIRVRALDAVDSQVTASSNVIAASATGNDAANTLSSATMDNLTVLAVPLAATGTARVDTTAESSQSGSALAIASSQKNTGNVAAANVTNGQFVVVDVSSASGVLFSAGIDSSQLTVSSNEVSATGIANNVTNSLQASVVNTLATSNGAAGQVASIANLQQNTNTTVGQQSAVLQSSSPAISIGIVYGSGDVTSTNSTSAFTVSDNLASASITGNKAVNQLGIATQNYGGTAGTTGVLSSTPGTGVSLVDSEFAVVNRQTDDISGGAGRLVILSGITVGVGINTGGDITDSKITASSNTIEGVARANEADNSLLLAGKTSSNLTTSAGLLNNQSTSTVTNVNSLAPVTASQVVVNAGAGFTLDNNQITLSDNTIRSSAEGNLAANLLGVVATNLTGNAAPTTGSSITGGSGLLTMNSDFALGNVQTASGALSSFVDGAVSMNFAGSTAVGGQITLSGNTVEAVARANKGTNTSVLTGVGNVSNISGTASVASYQSGSAAVTATQITSLTSNATVGIVGGDTDGTIFTITNNAVSAVAEQNRVENNLVVTGTNITGGGLIAPATYTPGTTVATTGSDFAVLNVQLGSGTITASATPGLIGTRISAFDSGSATVSDNVVVAMATVNTASNSLVLNAANALNATASVNNVQTSAGPAASATVSDTTVGVALPTGGATPVTINGTPVTISGNLLSATSGGNTASSSLTAASVPTIGNVGLPTFQILNYQTNAASMTSLVDAVSVGLPIGLAGSSINNSNLTVTGNQVLALAYGNSARNTLTTSSLIGSSSSWLTSTQINTGSLSSTVSGVTLGVTSPLITSTGVTGVVGSNTITAQTVGNSSSNLMTTSK
jgi:hypothetical protein